MKAAVPSERNVAAGLLAVPSPIKLILPSRSIVNLSDPDVSRSITNLLNVVVSCIWKSSVPLPVGGAISVLITSPVTLSTTNLSLFTPSLILNLSASESRIAVIQTNSPEGHELPALNLR